MSAAETRPHPVTSDLREAVRLAKSALEAIACGFTMKDYKADAEDVLLLVAALHAVDQNLDDVETFEKAWEERGAEIRANRQAEDEAHVDSSWKSTADAYAAKHGLVLVPAAAAPKKAKRLAAKRRAA